MIMFGGYLFFDSDPGSISICGAVAALCGMTVYTSQNFQKSGESLSKQNLPSPRPKPNDGESLLESDVKDAANVV